MNVAKAPNGSGPVRCWSGLLSVCLLISITAIADVTVQQRGGRSDDALRVTVEHDTEILVSIGAHDTPIRHILADIARLCGLDIVSGAPLDTTVSVTVQRQPLSRALARILRDHSYVLYTGRSGSGPQNKQQACPGLLWVFAETDSPGTDELYTANDWMIDKLRKQLQSADERARRAAIRDLQELGVQEVIGLLAEALGDENAKIRVDAVYALAEVGGDSAAAVLATALTDANTSVRAQTAYALGEVGGDSAIPMLKQALEDAELQVRETAIAAFTEIGGDQSAAAVAIALRDTETDLRIEAVDALVSIGGDVAMRLLAEASRDQDDSVREAAQEAMSMLAKQDP